MRWWVGRHWYYPVTGLLLLASFLAFMHSDNQSAALSFAVWGMTSGLVRVGQLERDRDRAEAKVLKIHHVAIEPSISDRLTPRWCRSCAKPSGVVWELTAVGDSGTAVIGTYGQCSDCGGHDIEQTP